MRGIKMQDTEPTYISVPHVGLVKHEASEVERLRAALVVAANTLTGCSIVIAMVSPNSITTLDTINKTIKTIDGVLK